MVATIARRPILSVSTIPVQGFPELERQPTLAELVQALPAILRSAAEREIVAMGASGEVVEYLEGMAEEAADAARYAILDGMEDGLAQTLQGAN